MKSIFWLEFQIYEVNLNREGIKKRYSHPKYGEIEVHMDSKGNIHGYPTGRY